MKTFFKSEGWTTQYKWYPAAVRTLQHFECQLKDIYFARYSLLPGPLASLSSLCLLRKCDFMSGSNWSHYKRSKGKQAAGDHGQGGSQRLRVPCAGGADGPRGDEGKWWTWPVETDRGQGSLRPGADEDKTTTESWGLQQSFLTPPTPRCWRWPKVWASSGTWWTGWPGSTMTQTSCGCHISSGSCSDPSLTPGPCCRQRRRAFSSSIRSSAPISGE